MLAKYQISVAKEEAEKVDTFRFAWQKLNTLAVSYNYKITVAFVRSQCPIVSIHIATPSMQVDKMYQYSTVYSFLD